MRHLASSKLVLIASLPVALLIYSTVSFLLTPLNAHAFANANLTKWEYCEVGITYDVELGDASAKVNVYFSSGQTREQKANIESLAKALKFEGKSQSKLEFFDHLGKQGWEMTTAFSFPNLKNNGLIDSVEQRWMFKRVSK
jgi:hypothetical protein